MADADPSRRRRQPDFLLFLAVTGLLTFGIIMVYSASQYIAADSSINDSFYYLKKQCCGGDRHRGVFFVIKLDIIC